jgi:hypothetical protein
VAGWGAILQRKLRGRCFPLAAKKAERQQLSPQNNHGILMLFGISQLQQVPFANEILLGFVVGASSS